METIEVVPASSLDSAAYGHGMPELAASCNACTGYSMFMPEGWDWDEV